MNFSFFFFLHLGREKNSFESEVSGFDESRESWLVMNFANCEDFAKSLSERNMIYWVIDVFCPRVHTVQASNFKKNHGLVNRRKIYLINFICGNE